MMENNFARSSILSRFILKRDKIRLIIWIFFLTLFLVGFVPIFKDIFSVDNPIERQVTVEMMQNPAMIAIVGPVYGATNYTTGAMYGNFMLVFSAIFTAIMSIMIVVRHTRHDEELGRLELIKSLPVGKLSNLASAMIVTVITNALLAILVGVGMYILREDGMDLRGCMIFGVGIAVCGIFFGVVAAIMCQITANGRTANALSYMVLIVLYLLRGVGDVSETEAVSMISPLGLVLRTKNFVEDNWWPIVVIVIISIVLMILAFYLAARRDMDAGLIPERAGKRHAGRMLSSPYGLALRLLRMTIIIWVISIFVLAAMYASVFGDLDSFISNNAMLSGMLDQNAGYTATDQFMSLLMVIMTLISMIPVVASIGRIAGEEKRGYATHLFSGSVSRSSQLTAYLIPAIILCAVLQVVTAIGFWSVGSVVAPDSTPSLETFMISAMSYVPAMLVVIGLSVFIVGFIPKRVSLSYMYLGYSFFVVYIGTLAKLPQVLQDITPFGHVPQYPIEDLEAMPLVVMTCIAAVLCIAGYIGYRRRDIVTPS
ncbi:MAG: ABC transporter permease [Suipraeoptans sp.]